MMENYFYKCKVCGYVHIVPAYWVSYSPEERIELEHVQLKTGETCGSHILELQQAEEV